MDKTYIAVVGNPENLGVGAKHPVAITDTDRERLIRKAIDSREAMGKNGLGGPYSIFIGTITSRIVTPVEYKLVPLGEFNDYRPNQI